MIHLLVGQSSSEKGYWKTEWHYDKLVSWKISKTEIHGTDDEHRTNFNRVSRPDRLFTGKKEIQYSCENTWEPQVDCERTISETWRQVPQRGLNIDVSLNHTPLMRGKSHFTLFSSCNSHLHWFLLLLANEVVCLSVCPHSWVLMQPILMMPLVSHRSYGSLPRHDQAGLIHYTGAHRTLTHTGNFAKRVVGILVYIRRFQKVPQEVAYFVESSVPKIHPLLKNFSCVLF